MKLTPLEVLTICKGDDEIASYFTMLLTIIDKQADQIERVEQRVRVLERQLAQNTRTNHNRILHAPSVLHLSGKKKR